MNACGQANTEGVAGPVSATAPYVRGVHPAGANRHHFTHHGQVWCLLSCVSLDSIGKRNLRLTFFESSRDQVDVLDVAKVADIVLFVMTPNADRTDVGLDVHGDHLLSCIKAQGVPAVMGICQVHRYFVCKASFNTFVLSFSLSSFLFWILLHCF